MLHQARSALRFFALGFFLGLILAPRTGEETRALVLKQIRAYLQDSFQSPPRS